MMEEFGLPKKTIEALEARMDSFSFETIVERMDEVFSKNWSYRFNGPDIVDVPTRVPKVRNAKNPKVYVKTNVPHWQCTCTISISTNELSEIVREYSVLVPVEDSSSFCVSRDLSLIYCAYYGLRVGKKSEIVFEDSNQVDVELELGGSLQDIRLAMQELSEAKAKLGIHKNVELDDFVKEFSAGELTSHKGITKTNLREFTNFLKTRVHDGSKSPGP